MLRIEVRDFFFRKVRESGSSQLVATGHIPGGACRVFFERRLALLSRCSSIIYCCEPTECLANVAQRRACRRVANESVADRGCYRKNGPLEREMMNVGSRPQ